MAIFHLNISSGSRGKTQSASAKYDYVCREGQYSKGRAELVAQHSGNMPVWAVNPASYWKAADLNERANGRLFNQVIVGLPHGLTEDQQVALATDFAKELATVPEGALPYTVAVHSGKGENPHAHIILSERVNDGHDRTADSWFKRAATVLQKKGESEAEYALRLAQLDPGKGGAKKTRHMKEEDWGERARQAWAVRLNEALAEQGREERVDHRSYARQGVDVEPTRHVGPEPHAKTGAKRERYERRKKKNEEIKAGNALVAEFGNSTVAKSVLAQQLAKILRGQLSEIREQIVRVNRGRKDLLVEAIQMLRKIPEGKKMLSQMPPYEKAKEWFSQYLTWLKAEKKGNDWYNQAALYSRASVEQKKQVQIRTGEYIQAALLPAWPRVLRHLQAEREAVKNQPRTTAVRRSVER